MQTYAHLWHSLSVHKTALFCKFFSCNGYRHHLDLELNSVFWRVYRMIIQSLWVSAWCF